MRGLDAAMFDATNLVLQGDDRNTRVWKTTAGDMVTLYDLPRQPPYRATPAELDRIRAKAREQATQYGGAIVEVEFCVLDGITAVREIVKVPQKPTGMGYLGSLALPLPDCAYLLSAACPERGLTGMRDMAVLAKLMQGGELKFDEALGKPLGWMQDPYDPTIVGPPARNRSDDEVYDVLYPEHPLSRVRGLLRQIEHSLRMSDDVKSA